MYRYWPIFEVSKFERHPYTAVYLSLSLLSVVRYTQVLSHVQSHMARSSKMSQWPSREDPQMQMMAMMVANTSIVLHDDDDDDDDDDDADADAAAGGGGD